MKISNLSPTAQAGVRRWGIDVYDDPNYFEGISVEEWAWAWFQLRASQDNPEWFPKGKWALLQVIQVQLEDEARQEIAKRAK